MECRTHILSASFSIPVVLAYYWHAKRYWRIGIHTKHGYLLIAAEATNSTVSHHFLIMRHCICNADRDLFVCKFAFTVTCVCFVICLFSCLTTTSVRQEFYQKPICHVKPSASLKTLSLIKTHQVKVKCDRPLISGKDTANIQDRPKRCIHFISATIYFKGFFFQVSHS